MILAYCTAARRPVCSQQFCGVEAEPGGFEGQGREARSQQRGFNEGIRKLLMFVLPGREGLRPTLGGQTQGGCA